MCHTGKISRNCHADYSGILEHRLVQISYFLMCHPMIFVIQVIATVSSVFSARANMCVIATLIADIRCGLFVGLFLDESGVDSLS